MYSSVFAVPPGARAAYAAAANCPLERYLRCGTSGAVAAGFGTGPIDELPASESAERGLGLSRQASFRCSSCQLLQHGTSLAGARELQHFDRYDLPQCLPRNGGVQCPEELHDPLALLGG